MKIVLLISSLAGGGAEKVLVRFATYWGERSAAVTVITTRSRSGDVYSLPDFVHREALGYEGLRWHQVLRRLRLILELRRRVKRLDPDVVVSFMLKTNIMALLALLGNRYPVVVSERSAPQRAGVFLRALRHILYRQAARVTVMTRAARDYFLSFLPARRLCVIPNPLMSNGFRCGEHITARELFQHNPEVRFLVCAMGRLQPVKGFHTLLEVFARLQPRHPDWGLLVLGEGAERPRLERMAESLGIDHSVLMPGRTDDPFPYLAGSALFACTSRYEGFGNAIVEAMASGVPVVSFDCPTGPREIITDGEDGILVPDRDKEAFVDKLEQLMDDPDLRARLSRRARDKVKTFDLDSVMVRWSELIAAATEREWSAPK
jgi:glycosyltransferase involved in cell wall biosynthesis